MIISSDALLLTVNVENRESAGLRLTISLKTAAPN
jgi:hypothetical protein